MHVCISYYGYILYMQLHHNYFKGSEFDGLKRGYIHVYLFVCISVILGVLNYTFNLKL